MTTLVILIGLAADHMTNNLDKLEHPKNQTEVYLFWASVTSLVDLFQTLRD